MSRLLYIAPVRIDEDGAFERGSKMLPGLKTRSSWSGSIGVRNIWSITTTKR